MVIFSASRYILLGLTMCFPLPLSQIDPTQGPLVINKLTISRAHKNFKVLFTRSSAF